MDLNFYFAWWWMLAGLVSGAVIGWFFFRPQWLGGYDSWQRRMVRLGHIAFLGTGLLNLAFALSVDDRQLQGEPQVASWLLVVGGVAMPTACFLSAWKPGWRAVFAVPVLSLVGGVVGLLWELM